MLFRFLSKSSGRFAYAGPMINAVSALIRSRYGMALDGSALNITQKLSETVLSVCKFPNLFWKVPRTKQNTEGANGRLAQHGAHLRPSCLLCISGVV